MTLQRVIPSQKEREREREGGGGGGTNRVSDVVREEEDDSIEGPGLPNHSCHLRRRHQFVSHVLAILWRAGVRSQMKGQRQMVKREDLLLEGDGMLEYSSGLSFQSDVIGHQVQSEERHN